MAKIERIYNIPLRTSFRNVPKYKRAKKAVNAVKRFITQHMKSENIKLGNNLNKFIWQNGIKNPPHHVKVTVLKEDDGLVKVELFGFNLADVAIKPAKKEKAEAPKVEEKKTEAPKTEAKETKVEDAKVEETKTEAPKQKKAPAKKVKKAE